MSMKLAVLQTLRAPGEFTLHEVYNRCNVKEVLQNYIKH